MDGNPDVHAKTIRETLARQQQRHHQQLLRGVSRTWRSGSRRAPAASPSRPSSPQRIEQYMTLAARRAAITPARHDRMPYRVFLAQMGERLRSAYEGRAQGYEGARQFRDDIALVASSLKGNSGANAGLFYVERLLRRIDTFGFHLATLDVRQHATCCTRWWRRGWAMRSGRRAAAPSGATCWPSRWRRTAARSPSWTRWASARSRCSRPSCRAGTATGPRQSATSSSAGRAARMTCSPRCCWRAGRPPTTSVPGKSRWTSPRSSRPSSPCAAAGPRCSSCSPTRCTGATWRHAGAASACCWATRTATRKPARAPRAS